MWLLIQHLPACLGCYLPGDAFVRLKPCPLNRNEIGNNKDKWLRGALAEDQDFECAICSRERKRRHRVLGEELETSRDDTDLHGALRSVRFKDCLYITRCNEPAGAYSMARARLFAQLSDAQLLWVQAEDFMDHESFHDYTMDKKKK